MINKTHKMMLGYIGGKVLLISLNCKIVQNLQGMVDDALFVVIVTWQIQVSCQRYPVCLSRNKK